MTIERVEGGGAALYITAEELALWGMSPATLTAGEAERLTRQALGRVEGDRTLRLDAFVGEGGVLIFARFSPLEPCRFSFPDSDSLLGAVEALGEDEPEGELVWREGRYYLTVPDRSRWVAVLSEFGRREDALPQGEGEEIIIEKKAVAVLRRWFGGGGN